MKILQIAPHFFPYMGGQESYIYNLSKNLIKKGHEVHIMTSNYPKSNYYDEIEGMIIERNDLIMRPLRNPISSGFFNIKKLSNMFDVIHIHNLYAFPSILAAYYKNKFNNPLIFTDHGKLVFGVSYKDLLVRMYSKTIAKRILEKSDLVTVLSESQKNHLCSISPNSVNKIQVIPNAIDIELFKQLNDNNKKNENSSFTFLYVGQMIKRKGIYWLLKALKIVIKSNKNIKLILVGDGEHLNYYKKLANDLNLSGYIEFKGRIDDMNNLASIYKSSDVFVLPSLSEGLPTVLLEAMFFGLPVIATDIPGIKDHFENYASLVPPKDSVKLAEAIIELSKKDNLEQAKKLSKEFMNLIESNYSWKAVAEEYEMIYESVLNREQLFGEIPQSHQSEEIKINQSK
ncbi:MAG: glycosyltransferase family 4 protein [Methanobacteriaceae archaeon]|nr:glycosyltransferase family 4 protein [Methanobacteriaceae archaeon]